MVSEGDRRLALLLLRTVSDDGQDGAITREGYLFEWSLPDIPACQTEWLSFRHEPGRVETTTVTAQSPGGLGDVAGGRRNAGFTATGDDGECGSPDH